MPPIALQAQLRMIREGQQALRTFHRIRPGKFFGSRLGKRAPPKVRGMVFQISGMKIAI